MELARKERKRKMNNQTEHYKIMEATLEDGTRVLQITRRDGKSFDGGIVAINFNLKDYDAVFAAKKRLESESK